jgi:hypothetical protein
MVGTETLRCEVALFGRFKFQRLGLAGENLLMDVKAVVREAALLQQFSQQHGVVVRIGQQCERGIETQQPVENPLPRCPAASRVSRSPCPRVGRMYGLTQAEQADSCQPSVNSRYNVAPRVPQLNL